MLKEIFTMATPINKPTTYVGLVILLLFSQFLSLQSIGQTPIIKNNIQAGTINIHGNLNNGDYSKEDKGELKNELLESRILKLFSKDTTKYKVLIFPFKQQTHYLNCSKDYAEEAYDHLTELNRLENLNIAIGWLTVNYDIPPDFTSDSFEALGHKLNADFILYGNYDKNCNSESDSGQVCVKYKSFSQMIEKTSGEKVKISDIDYSRGDLISDVKGLLYDVAAVRYWEQNDSLYHYYSQKALLHNTTHTWLYFRNIYYFLYRNSHENMLSYNKFNSGCQRLLNIIPFEIKSSSDSVHFASTYSLIGASYLYYGNFDSAFSFFSRALCYGKLPATEYYLGASYSAIKQKQPAIARQFLEKRFETSELVETFLPYDTFAEISIQILIALEEKDYDLASSYYECLDGSVDSIASMGTYFSMLVKEAVIALNLNKLVEAQEAIKIAQAINNQFGIISLSISNMPERVSLKNWTDFRVLNYFPNSNFEYSYNGKVTRLIYLNYMLQDSLGAALYWANYYIDTLEYLLPNYIDKNAKHLPYYHLSDVINIYFEDYFNRALIEYKLGKYNESTKDVEKCLLMNDEFYPAMKLLKLLRKKGYGKHVAYDKKVSKESFNVSLTAYFDEWDW